MSIVAAAITSVPNLRHTRIWASYPLKRPTSSMLLPFRIDTQRVPHIHFITQDLIKGEISSIEKHYIPTEQTLQFNILSSKKRGKPLQCRPPRHNILDLNNLAPSYETFHAPHPAPYLVRHSFGSKQEYHKRALELNLLLRAL